MARSGRLHCSGRAAEGGSLEGNVNRSLERLLAELIELGRAHDAARSDRRERLRNLEPESARLLWLLARVMRARQVLELGTSNGYSTLWLTDAVVETNGRVTTVELEPMRARMAQENFARAGLEERIELQVADAAKILANSPNDVWDLVFLDAERQQYVGYWPDLVRSIRPLGLLAVDNVLSHAHELTDFRGLVDGTKGVAAVLVPIGAGLLLITKELASVTLEA
jgi:predicted O-methyltransferase YrrM